MIITKTKLRIYASGRGQKWKKGILQLKKSVLDLLKWEEQDLILVLINPNELQSETKEEITQRILEAKKYIEIEEEINKLKEETYL